MRKVIVRIKGGLGNQLFCYAAARRLALINNAELVIDDITGFTRDNQYYRQYALDRFSIPVRKATAIERLEPFERCRRAALKWSSRRKVFAERRYLEQEGLDFDARLLTVRVQDTLFLDGLWQSEGYFKDVEQIVREDLRITPPTDVLGQCLADEILNSEAVAVHMRWFDVPGSTATYNLSADYYQRAIALVESEVDSPHYFLFSDNPGAAMAMLKMPDGRVTCIAHNQGHEKAYADLWLMTQCRHFITANSTFSWWGAWLGTKKNKIVLTPKLKLDGKTAWGFKGLIPNEWLVV